MSVERPSMSIERIREALAAGPTPGPWYLRTNRHPTTDGRAWGWLDTQPPGGSQCAPPGLQITWERGSKSATNAAYIAACNPEAIRELLAERDALLDALQHMRHCAWCAADDWQNCEGGRAALAAIDAAKGRA